MKIVFRCDPALADHLPRPVAAGDALPDWLRRMPVTARSELTGQAVRTVKQCPPFVEAMRTGFLMPLPCDVRVEAGRFEWDWQIPGPSVREHPRAPLAFHVPAQLSGMPGHDPRHAAIKFNSFWTIELEPGWSLFATHPANREDLPFRTLTGLVHADLFNDAGINFPALWTEPDFSGVLPKGLPVVQCFAVPREPAELVFESLDASRAAGYSALVQAVMAEPGVYRKRFRPRRPRG
ncbi:hypothetical protein MWN34_10945 [Ancylobacter sp. 6x-1]|uniref:Uncharacterized protein n=1 Tax=Ancylobacter crimeensis TaxID=2579147 RepID=A0ABT0DBU3_9HYPH|nr:hypothetical protein [Ancylobacter crimeensis]MCK0197430.1 hypothetical protein [Ancylobacter crimeensis]